MSTKTLDDRREALEEAFFRQENDRLLRQLRDRREREQHREALGDAIGYHDDELLDRLLDAGLAAETWLALTVVPLVEVAWADREVTQAEQDVILSAAAEHGIQAGSEAARLLAQWLDHRPHPRLRDAWKAYVSTIRETFDSSQRQALHDDTLARAREVAQATNHLLGIGRHVSDVETEVLQDLESVL